MDLDGFNLHASVAIAADDDLGRERLMRYGARPPLALERLRRMADGRVAYRIKKFRDGRAKHRVMTPLELLARLAALVPPPRYPLLRYVGALGPRSAWRRDIAPLPRRTAKCAEGMSANERNDRVPRPSRKAPDRAATAAGASRSRRDATDSEGKPASHEAREEHAIVAVPGLARTLARTDAVVLAPNILGVAHWDRLLGGLLYAATPRVEWSTLLRRSFEVDVLACARCGGRLRVLGEVTEPAAVRSVLGSLGLPAEAPRAARARDPTDLLSETAGD